MKKILQTCFLGYLCLIGSPSSAQSRVADSPPEAPLYPSALHVSPHPEDTHRGGVALSDTFPFEEFGLFSRYLDPGAGEEATSLQPAPVTVSALRSLKSETAAPPQEAPLSDWTALSSPVSGLPSQYIGHPIPSICHRSSFSLVDQHLDSGAGEESYVLQSAPVTVLDPVIQAELLSSHLRTGFGGAESSIDTTISTGQEGVTPSASVRDQLPQAVIWGRVSEYGDRSQVQLTVFPEYFFPSTKAPGSNLLYLPLKNGNIMEGGYPKDKSFQYNLEARNRRQWFSLALGTSPFLDRFLIEAGDSVQIFLNLETNSLVFAGPAAEKFKLQQGLERVRSEFLAKTTPVLYTQYPERVLQNPEYRAQMKEAIAAAGPVIQIKKRSLAELDELAKYELYREDGPLMESWRWIDSFTGQVGADYQFLFKKEVELREWKGYMDQIYSNLLFASKENIDTVFIERAKAVGLHAIRRAETFVEEDIDHSSAAMMDYLATKTKLQSMIFEMDLIDVAEFIPQKYWREKYLVSHFYESYQRIDQVEERLDHWIASVENQQLLQYLREVRDLKGSGSLVSGFEFLDEDGDLTSFSEVSQGDLILVEFWISGCKACVAFNEGALKALKEKYRNDPRFQVITVSADFNPEIWKASIQSGRYTQPEFTNLYTGQSNRNHPFLLRYGISSFPTRILIDRYGKFIQASQVPFLASDLIQLVDSYLEQYPTINTESEP